MLKSAALFIKRDPVLAASAFLAALSAFFVPPSPEYISYIDFRVLALLLSLMLLVAGFNKAGLFAVLTERLLRLCHSIRALACVLFCLCFFGSMFITNDVALITFVPLTIMVLKQTKKTEHMILFIVLQTVAANLGSMLTPLGNPQNLYLYSSFGLDMWQFLRIMAVPTAGSFILLTASVFLLPKEEIAPSGEKSELGEISPWLILFILCLLAVVHLFHYAAVLAVVVCYVFIKDRLLLFRADYALLLTFVFFFIFIGNMKSIPAVSRWLSNIISGREMTIGILLSQAISNVPAAMLMSGFTKDFAPLLLGVNLGGLGTLIASMASLISYKLYGALEDSKKGKYLITFTAVNVAFLALLWIFVLII